MAEVTAAAWVAVEAVSNRLFLFRYRLSDNGISRLRFWRQPFAPVSGMVYRLFKKPAESKPKKKNSQ